MYKGRLGLWASILAVALLLQVLSNISLDLFKGKEDLKVNVDAAYDSALSSYMNSTKYSDYRLISVNVDAEPDIIIRDKGVELSDTENYTKVTSLYSPLVFYSLGGSDKGFVNLSSERSSYPILKVDLLSILNGLDAGKTWQDLGFSKDVLSGPITLTIPNEGCAYYSNVVDLFYATFNGGTMPDDDKKLELKDKVVSVLSKCNKVADVRQAMLEADHKNKLACIGPEYIFIRNGNSFASHSTIGFRVSYFNATSNVECDVYTKNNTVDSRGSEVISSGNHAVDDMRNEVYYTKKFGWRVTASTWNIANVFYILTPTYKTIY